MIAPWCEAKGKARGEVMRLDALWELAKAWYENRLSPDYRGRTTADVQAIFARFGLTSPFWQSAAPADAPQK